MGSVLILGASLLQRPAIEAAIDIGLTPLVVDGNPNAPCFSIDAVFGQVIDLKDKNGILDFARKISKVPAYKIEGVFTAGTDFSCSVAFITEVMGLCGHSYEAALSATDKGLMRQRFLENGVPSPKFFVCQNLEEAKEAAKNLPLPFVIKPTDNMGARGCMKVEELDKLESAFLSALAASRTKAVILEEYMEGDEYSIDALVLNGEVTITGFALRDIRLPPYFIEVGHTVGHFADLKNKWQIIETFVKGVKALGLSCGAAKGDMKWVEGRGAMVGEIAGRLSGGYMSGWTFPLASHFPLTREALKIATGRTPDELFNRRDEIGTVDGIKVFEVKALRYCAERALIARDGVLKDVRYKTHDSFVSPNVWQRAHNVTYYFLRPVMRTLPAKVFSPHDNTQKLANVICTGVSLGSAINAAQNAINDIELVYT